MKEEVAQLVTEKLTESGLDMNHANQLLVSSVIKYLSDMQVIDLQHYLEFSKSTKENILSNFTNESDKMLHKMIELTFDRHRKDFEKPE